MKLVTLITLRPLAAVAALTLFGSLPLAAGESIQFSREKARPTGRPDESVRLSKEVASQPKGLAPNTPTDLLPSVAQEVRPRDPREERRRKTAENEKKNWMFHERGEGRDREGEELGIRDYSIEKEDGSQESIFAPKANDSRGRPRLSSSPSRLSSQEQEDGPAPRPPESTKEAKRPDSEGRPQPGGDHVSKDLDLRTLLNGGKISLNDSAESADRAETTSRNTRVADLAARARGDQERRPNENSVVAPGPADSKSAGLGDTLGAGNSVTAPRATPSSLAPVAPRPSDINNPFDRTVGVGVNSSRSGLDSGASRSFNNPYSIYPPALSTPYYDSRNANSGYGSPSSFTPRSPQNTAPSQSTWDKSRIPRP